MCITCIHVVHMSKMIQIRNVPNKLHRELKVRAAQEGMTLSAYLLAELRQTVERPTIGELRERLRGRAPVRLRVSAAEAVRAERDRR